MRTAHRKATTRKVSKGATRLAASVALVAGAASVAGLGTFGSFTSTTSATEATTTGTVVLTASNPARGFDVAIPKLVPTDTVQRALTLTRGSADETFGSVALTTTSSTANVLTGDATKGLQMRIDQCSQAYTQVGSTNALTCGGTETPVLASGRVLQANTMLPVVTTALNAAAKTSFLRVTLTLPEAADNTFQNLTSTINYSFLATQRAGDFQ
ncbi:MULTISPECIES: TasA family protein [unclassified Nocardioides]|uniref:TasA family protein n=1 Tax=unclassified Nocardioides TaxID=2615069 RepID=UPI000703781B|nr:MULTISPECIES: TasA family protein [unclassified Nocardioides]KQP66863.1 hypothetical protein ASF47_03900 [Nocardioides sp. Leaf285]KQQ41434.1 hypothetical protein ASF50_10480 [Nocardioides sp. Leaf307]MBJ7530352.1 hypothetical protein [Nocardioides sp.]